MEENKEEKVYVNLKKVDLPSDIEDKKKKRKTIFLNFSIFTLLILVGFILGFLSNSLLHPVNSTDPSNTFGEIEAVMEKYYLYKNDFEDINTELQDKAFYGMTDFEDDPYTTYMSKQEIDEFAESINMNYVGIGVVYSMQDGFGLIKRVIIDSPAQKAGLQAGDLIMAVDGVSIEGLSSDEVKEMVTGEEGTPVVITISRNDELIDYSINRGNVDNSAYGYCVDDYIYLNIYSFGENTGKECMSYLDQYTDYHKVIIDIRDNSGGYQTSVAELAGLFIGDNEVYLIQTDGDGNAIEAYTSCSKTYDNFDEIVILVNENTASAAEVFALCLREQLDYVTLVGTTTYGKGVMQSTHLLANGGALKFTSYEWASPNGVSINGTGIAPDVEVEMDDIYYAEYKAMDEDESYTVDSVSDANKLTQIALNYLDYEVDRTDGYFDQSTANALYEYKVDNNLTADEVLDKDAYESIISKCLVEIYSGVKDYQLQKAVELVSD